MLRIWAVAAISVLVAFMMFGDAVAQDGGGEAEFARSDLVIPSELWEQVRADVGYAGRPLGYTADEMEHFRGSECVLRQVEMLFRDITSIPQFTGRFGDLVIGYGDNFAGTTFETWKLLDAYGARVMSYEAPSGWEVDWLEPDADADEVFTAIYEMARASGTQTPITDEDRAQWETLPDEAKMLALRVIVAAMDATPWLMESFDKQFYLDYFGVEKLDQISMERLYEFASHPWQDEAPDPTPRESFDALDRFDRRFFATGSNEFMRMTWGAIKQYQLSTSENELDFGGFTGCEFETSMGLVGIFADGANEIEGEYSLIIDLGGDDVYGGATAVPRSMLKPVGVVIDLGGNDRYGSEAGRASLACGNHGIGAIFDLGGNDSYICDESGIACGWYGTGLVVDYSGDDYYYSRIWGQAAAHAGIGVLMDLAGDDRYECIEQSQAFGSTYGAGVIVDLAGDDVYFADPEGKLSETFEYRTVNFAQGTGFGRRADFYDGHSLGGGFGILVEGDGNDSYTGSVYSQGAGYWWAVGALEDRAGNDTYSNEQYSCGSAPHFAIGCCVDLMGDDAYNVGNEDVERQIQGHARDGSIAVFIDGAGDDDYFLPNMAAGSSDLNCLTLFWDRMGDDHYVADRNPPRATAYSFGDSTRYSRFNTFRDEMASIGIFLDTGGVDVYEERDPVDADEETIAGLVRIPFGNDREWMQLAEDPNYGYGLDGEWVPIASSYRSE
jgi:hypothetical protein